MIQSGEVANRAELARLGHVSQPRVTQIMNLLNLAPDIQEEILNLAPVSRGRDPIHEKALRPIAALMDWRGQRRRWRKLQARIGEDLPDARPKSG